MKNKETSPEALRSLTSPELDQAHDEAMFALKAAQEAVLDIQDERFRRWYNKHVLRINETTTLA